MLSNRNNLLDDFNQCSTTGDGNCGFNSFALFIWDYYQHGHELILDSDQKEYIGKLLAEPRPSCVNTWKRYANIHTWEDLIAKLKTLKSPKDIERLLSPLLRELLYRVVKYKKTQKAADIRIGYFEREIQPFIRYYLCEKAGMSYSYDQKRKYKYLHAIPELTKKLDEIYDETFAEPLKELAKINPRKIEDQNQYDTLTAIKALHDILAGKRKSADMPQIVRTYFAIKAGANSEMPEFLNDKPGIVQKLDEKFKSLFTQPLAELELLDPNTARDGEEKKRYQSLLKTKAIYDLLAKGQISAEEVNQVDSFLKDTYAQSKHLYDDLQAEAIDEFIVPYFPELKAFWDDKGWTAIGRYLRTNTNWIDDDNIAVLSDYFGVSLMAMNQGFPVTHHNLGNYPDSYRQEFPSRDLLGLRENQKSKKQLFWLNNENIIIQPPAAEDRAPGWEYYPLDSIQLNKVKEPAFLERIQNLSAKPEFNDFNFERLIRLNFENNRYRATAALKFQGAHWTYLQPKKGFGQPQSTPYYLQPGMLSPLTIAYIESSAHDTEFADYLRALLKDRFDGNEIDALLADLNALSRDYSQKIVADDNFPHFKPEHLSFYVDRPEHFEKIAAEATYTALTYVDEPKLSPALLRYLLEHNPHFAGYYHQHNIQPDLNKNLIYDILSNPNGIDLELLKIIHEKSPEALQQPCGYITENNLKHPVHGIHVAISNPSCKRETLRQLIQMGIPIGTINPETGKTSLQVAIESGKINLALVLLQQPRLAQDRLDITHKDKQGNCVLDVLDVSHIDLTKSKIDDDIKEVAATAIHSLSEMQTSIKELGDTDPDTVALTQFVTEIRYQLDKIQNNSSLTPEDIYDYFDECTRISHRNVSKLQDKDFFDQCTKSLFYSLTLIGFLHLVKNAIEKLFYGNNDSYLFFASAAQKNARQLESNFHQLVDHYRQKLPPHHAEALPPIEAEIPVCV